MLCYYKNQNKPIKILALIKCSLDFLNNEVTKIIEKYRIRD